MNCFKILQFHWFIPVNVSWADSYESVSFVAAIGTVFVLLKGGTNFILKIRVLLSGYSYLYY